MLVDKPTFHSYNICRVEFFARPLGPARGRRSGPPGLIEVRKLLFLKSEERRSKRRASKDESDCLNLRRISG